jgi:signal transduction histidine kinase
VSVGYGATGLDLSIRNVGGTTSTNGGDDGHGITGMRERVQLFGGTLEAEPRADGFEVHAVLPYDEVPSA